MSDKYDSVNKHTQEINESMKLDILGVWQASSSYSSSYNANMIS